MAPSSYLLGGLACWLDYLLPGLQQRGWDAVLGLVEGPRHHRPDRYLSHHPHGRVVTIPCRTGTDRGRIRAIRRELNAVRPDIVLSVNIPHAIVAVAEEAAANGHQSKAVLACHGIEPYIVSDQAYLKDVADAVICTNRLATQLARSVAGWSDDRSYYAPCGSKISMLVDRPLQAPLKIAYIGRLEQDQKRVRDLPMILRQLDSSGLRFEFIVAGSGEEEAWLREACSEMTHGRVEFLGHIPASELPSRVYQQADIVLVPSRWETGPIVIWEAMAECTLVVCSRYVGSGLENALRHRENCMMFEIGDTGAAAAQILELCQHSELRQTLRRSAWQLVRARYSQEASITAWEECLLQILDSPLQRPINRGRSQSSGVSRLDAIFGGELGEYIRHMVGAIGPDSGPGGEWPHSIATPMEKQEFWRLATERDLSSAG